MAIDNRGRMWPKFPDICLTVEGKLRETSTRKLTRLGIEPGPVACEITNVTPRPRRWSNYICVKHLLELRLFGRLSEHYVL